MDEPTVNLFDALRSPGAALLFELLAGPATEERLRQLIKGMSQPTINRKLESLRTLGLITRESGPKRAKGLKWSLTLPDETLRAYLAFSRLIESSLRLQSDSRAATERRIRKAFDRTQQGEPEEGAA